MLSTLVITAAVVGYQGAAQANNPVSGQSIVFPKQSKTQQSMQPTVSRYASMSALDMAKQNPELSILVEAVEAAGISRMLAFAGRDYTIFAPSNAAFESLFEETRLTKQSLMRNKPLLRMLLGYHVVKAKKPLLLSELPAGVVQTFNQKFFAITSQRMVLDGRGRVSHIIHPNITTRNGVVHVVDKVLFPAQ